MSWDSQSRSKGIGMLLLVVILLAEAGCTTSNSQQQRVVSTPDAIFVSLGKLDHMVILRPPLLDRLFGEDWSRQQIFVDHSHYFLGQPAPPILLWKTDGLVFHVDWRQVNRDFRRQPFWVMLYSLDKGLAYRVSLDCDSSEVKIIWVCHTAPRPERVYHGYLIDGLPPCVPSPEGGKKQ